jgi:hypothetical protein
MVAMAQWSGLSKFSYKSNTAAGCGYRVVPSALADQFICVLMPAGTDVTFGPDDQAYRFTAKDQNAEYAATRFEILPATKSLSGKFVYTNRGLSVDRESQANAGAADTPRDSMPTVVLVCLILLVEPPYREPTCCAQHPATCIV